MAFLDLTLSVDDYPINGNASALKEVKIPIKNALYTGMCYDFNYHSMCGTYIDLPGHIREINDVYDASTYPIENLFRLSANIIHLERKSGSGAVSAKELQNALGRNISSDALIINALGNLRFDEIEERSVFFAEDAVEWIISSGIKLIISDIYECTPVRGVFYDFFKQGICTVCNPINMHNIKKDSLTVTTSFLRMPKVTQIPCRVLAEI